MYGKITGIIGVSKVLLALLFPWLKSYALWRMSALGLRKANNDFENQAMSGCDLRKACGKNTCPVNNNNPGSLTPKAMVSGLGSLGLLMNSVIESLGTFRN